LKNTHHKKRRASRVAQVVEYLPSKSEALVQTPVAAKKKKNPKTQTKQLWLGAAAS
jgi:hypothetical protein